MKQKDVELACAVCMLASNTPELCVAGTVMVMVASCMHGGIQKMDGDVQRAGLAIL